LKLRRFIPVLIIAAGVWAYHNSFQGPFIFDDVPSIVTNPHIRRLWPLAEAMVVSPNLPVQGRPVECLTLALNYAVDGLNVWGYHAFNVMLHVVSTLVLFGLLRRTFAGGKLRDRFGNAATGLAAAIALIWEVHPLQTESVTYIVQRSELLMGLFLLLTLYCTLRGSLSARACAWYLAAVVSCALGMGSKEVMVSAPVIVLLYDRVFLASSFHELWQRRAGLYVGLATTWLILVVLVARTIHPNTGFGIRGLTPWVYLKTEAGVIVYYLRLCFWPHPLVIDYADWPITLSLKDGLASGVAVLGLLGATVWAFRRQPAVGFLGAWFFLILGPTSSFLPSAGEVAAERRMYLPLAAVVTMVVVGAYGLGKHRLAAWPRLGRLVAWGMVGAVALWLAVLTIQRNFDYGSAVRIWEDTVAKRPGNPRAHYNLGVALGPVERIDEAVEQYDQALRINPDYTEAHYNLGVALGQLGKIDEAIEQYKQALRINPDYAEAHDNLGTALRQLGKIDEAIEQYKQALRIMPDFAMAHYNLGNALRQAGKIDDAIAHYQQALRIEPDFADAHNNLGTALGRVGRIPEAIGHLQQALRIRPDLAETHYNLGIALGQVGRIPEAIDQLQQALRINPNYIQAQNALARLQAR
jgi:tetratricopeptide (TPR) repeat protein